MAKVVLKLEDDVSTDAIYPGRYMATVLPGETPQYTFADDKEFNGNLNQGRIPRGSIIIGGKNFGCGSSREQAASCLKGWDLIVLAKSFARIFLQNSVNLGLLLIPVPDIQAELGHEIKIEAEKVINNTLQKSFNIIPLSKTERAVMDAGGLIAYTRAELLKIRKNK
ncbi:MAG: 3-isopropylmalate dehydratase [bacterium]